MMVLRLIMSYCNGGGAYMKVRLLTVSSTMENEKEVAFIRISGKWLEALGFKAGSKYIVEEKHGQLILKLVNIEE